jgi:hypothetical protein
MKRILFLLLLLLSLPIPSMFFSLSYAADAAEDAERGCLQCHKGIEQISDTPVMSTLTCEQCHKGNPEDITKEGAHEGMYANPSDYRVIGETCGQCHPEEVEHSKKSLHATMAGMISGTRYANAAQDKKNAYYATYDIEDKDGIVPFEKGGLKSLKQLPVYNPAKPMSQTNHVADDYLRDQCLMCHLWSSGHERDGDYRASGCAACHVIYSDRGTYEGRDKAIQKEQRDRPRFHRITKKIPEYQCIHCHNRGGRTGVSFIGTMESDGYGSPWSTVPGEKGGKELHGKYYNHLTEDVHYQKGMTCIDCHTKQDLHGDGNIYSKKWQAVEIECQDCHGTYNSYSSFHSSWGNPLENLKKDDGKIILISKLDEKERVVPQTKDIVVQGSPLAKAAMGLGVHMNKMECYACHAKWAPQCYGCHVQQNLAVASRDWINTKMPEDPSKAGLKVNRENTTFQWLETRSYLRWESPALGINAEGKVSPFIPGCQVIFTQISPEGEATMHNKVFMTADKTYGIATNPIQPHTVTKEARTCEDCHAGRKTIGLGTGHYNSKANGLALPFELERIVDESGKQLQATNHVGARPFNKEEQERILRTNVCVSCHNLQRDSHIWKKITDDVGYAGTIL